MKLSTFRFVYVILSMDYIERDSMMKKERNLSLDAIRCVAILLVIILHSTSLGGALGRTMFSPAFSLALFLRQLGSACIPLFLLLTGFLQYKKEVSLKLFVGIIPLWVSYAIISALTLILRLLGDSGFEITFGEGIYRILNFTANDYAWYFEMYIGLFLLIPFLNLAYSSLKSKHHKLLLIGILFFLTMMPEVTKSFAPYYKNGGVALDVIPDFFKEFYPITYYYIGAYISEYRPRLKVSAKVLSLIVAPLIPFSLCTLFSYTRGEYAWYMMNGNNAPTALFTALAIFLSLYDINFKPGKLTGLSRVISECTFEMYLFSFIFDSYVYGPGNMPVRLERYFSQFGLGALANGAIGLPFIICVIFVFVGSFVGAYIIRKLAVVPISVWVKRISGGKTENSTK